MKKKRHEIESFSNKGDLASSSNQALVQSTPPHPAIGLIFAGVGLFPLLVGLGVVHVDPASVHAPLFVLVGVGIAFICAGLSISVQGLGLKSAWISSVLGLCCLAGFLTPFFWIVFGNNDMPLPVRICFGAFLGIFALIIVLVTIVTRAPGLAERLGIRIVEAGKEER